MNKKKGRDNEKKTIINFTNNRYGINHEYHGTSRDTK